MLSWCGRKNSAARNCARCEGRDLSVASVVLNACVHVSSVTSVCAGSSAIAGGSESRSAKKGGGWVIDAACAGSGGTFGASSKVEIVFTLSEERRDGARGISAGAGSGGGGLLGRRGGDDFPPGLSGSASVSSSSESSAGSGGRGGKGGLVGVGGDSTAARAAAARLVSTEEWCEMRFSFLGLIVAAASGARRTPVSRRASSGVRTTVAPAPNVPPRGEPTSMVRARLGSVGRVGRDGADAGAEAGGELLRDNQCIVLEMEGRRGCEGGGLTRDWLWERA